MQAVINPGDVVVTMKSFQWMSFRKGDIVAFQKRNDKTTFVKRIYASEGDTLKLLRNHIKIGDRKIPHDSAFEIMLFESEHPDSIGFFSSYDYQLHLLKNSGLPTDSINDGDVFSKEQRMIVPEGYYFMVGDNFYESMDSRFWGFIPKENIKGKLVWIF